MIQVTVITCEVKYCFQIASDNSLYAEWSARMTDDVGTSDSYTDLNGTTSTWTVYRPEATDCNVWQCGEKVSLTSDEISSIVIISPYSE